jgi:hypothetical protein
MLGIIYTHVLYEKKELPNIPYITNNRYKSKIISSYTYICWLNNAHSLISAVVGYKSNKYCNLLHLWICLVFIQWAFDFIL